jgi:protein TonB
MGTNKGTGIGDGKGPGVGPGEDGNIGGGPRQSGNGESGGSLGNNPNGQPRILRGSEVEQRARLLSKPEPQYTEEARRNQVTGTVVLRVVFSSMGEVVDIHAVRLLPFGLTEKAIAAARQIRFQPATRGGQPVSVYMQLEYNFNLY